MSQQPKQPSSPDSTRGKHFTPAPPDAFKRKASVGETAGQVTADCAAVCCCCSFGLINLFYFCFIKLPTGLFLRSARNIKRRARRCRKVPDTASCSCSTKSCSSKTKKSSLLYSFEEEIDERFEMGDQAQVGTVLVFDLEPTKEVVELEKEMWSNFANSGFGRSLSCRYK